MTTRSLELVDAPVPSPWIIHSTSWASQCFPQAYSRPSFCKSFDGVVAFSYAFNSVFITCQLPGASEAAFLVILLTPKDDAGTSTNLKPGRLESYIYGYSFGGKSPIFLYFTRG